MSDPSPNVVAALTALDAATEPLPAYVVGNAVVRAARARGERTVGQRGARYVGPGAIASPVLRSLGARGWAVAVPRPDEGSGTAWEITQAGREALQCLTG